MTFRGFAEVVARNGCRNDWEKVMLLSGVLRGRWLVVARVAWGVIATLTMGVFVASNSAYVADILQLGQASWMGAPVEASEAWGFALDLLGVLASVVAALLCLTLGIVLFWRRLDDGMVVFISSKRSPAGLQRRLLGR
jgi:hypothetical protein